MQVWRHLHRCSACRSEFEQIQALRALLAEAGRVAPPENLALAIRLRISQEASLGWRDRLRLGFQDIFRPLAVPALAGLCSAFLMFTILIHTAFALPAVRDDIPVYLLTTPARVISMASLDGIKTGEGILIQVEVDQEGRVADYHLLTPVSDPETIAQIQSVLVFTRFQPATAFGAPRVSTQIINLSYVPVKG